MGLCPIAPPKGFPNVYGARLAHRPLETFGRKYLGLLLKYRRCELDSPIFTLRVDKAFSQAHKNESKAKSCIIMQKVNPSDENREDETHKMND